MIKESIKTRFQKMIKYCDELINKCTGKTINDLYIDDNFAEASCFVLGLIDEQVPGIIINSNGMSVKDDRDANAAYIHWAVVAPHNNKQLVDEPKYIGVGGHLFAIAIDKSFDREHNGVVYGFASNEKVLQHYIEKLNATYLGLLHKKT